MAYARLHIVRAFHQREVDVLRETSRLLDHLSTQPGFMAAWELESVGDPQVIVRGTLWETREQADHAANQEKPMAIISHILTMAEETTIGSGVFDATVTLPGGQHLR